MTFFFFFWGTTLLGQSEKIVTAVNIDFNQSGIINIITFAEQLCIIKNNLFSLLVDKNNAHQVHKYDVKNQIYLSLSPMFFRRTFLSKLKVMKTNVICYMAIHSTLYTGSSASTISKKYIRHRLKETNLYKSDHPQCI